MIRKQIQQLSDDIKSRQDTEDMHDEIQKLQSMCKVDMVKGITTLSELEESGIVGFKEWGKTKMGFECDKCKVVREEMYSFLDLW